MKTEKEYTTHWTTRKQPNYRYFSYMGDRIGCFITVSIHRFGFGFDFFNYILITGEKRTPKLMLYIGFITINLTYHAR